ncbi:hypothetical protein B0H16DRAFT_1744833 [Mycena metata]|uniref:Uncharacterized protein n=1 Tax=Mycena metata TaxID=1033252 RepID=A0AAD7MD64_9AGAR|nr:hypothetical protein B0H16DRAFT_1744833 [Mycena metata]
MRTSPVQLQVEPEPSTLNFASYFPTNPVHIRPPAKNALPPNSPPPPSPPIVVPGDGTASGVLLTLSSAFRIRTPSHPTPRFEPYPPSRTLISPKAAANNSPPARSPSAPRSSFADRLFGASSSSPVRMRPPMKKANNTLPPSSLPTSRSVTVNEHVVICTGCDYAIFPSALVKHVRTAHGLPLLAATERPVILATLASYGIHETADSVRFPSFGGALIEGLEAPKEGYSNSEHKAKCGGLSSSVGIRSALIQTFFSPGNQKWFEVEPSMKGIHSGDPFALYQATYGLEFDEIPTILHGSENGREVPPMSKLTGSDAHLSEWLATRPLVYNLRRLVAVQELKKEEVGMSYLPGITLRYLERISKHANSSDLHVCSLLMDCPRTDNRARVFKPHTVENTIRKYGDQLHHFTYVLLLSVSDSSPTTYKFPLSDLEEAEVLSFAKKAQHKAAGR